MSLTQYKQKRDFQRTPEPVAAKGVQKSTLSFVVQRHHASHLHYDFRLEIDGVLKSWAVPKGPSMVAGEKRLAVLVEDHPLAYGRFYGEIPAGNYGARIVHIWDSGTYTPTEATTNAEKTLRAQMKKGDIKIHLKGTHLKGNFALVRMQDEKNWLLIKKADEYAVGKFDIQKIDPLKTFHQKKKTTTKADSSQKHKKDTKVTPAKVHSLPAVTPKPMLASLSDAVIDDPTWLYEIKYDGYRSIATVQDRAAELWSRNGNSFTKAYDAIAEELQLISETVILDGEIVIENKKNLSDFQLLQNYRLTKEGDLKYYVFDVLFLNGHSVTSLTLIERKELLALLFENYKFKHIHLSGFKTGQGKKVFAQLSEKGYEGMIAKDPQSAYLPGRRSDSWLKVKTTQMQKCVIAGYTLPQNSRKHFGSLILGMYSDKELIYIGNCGTGFTEASLKELHSMFEKLITKKCPFDKPPILTGTKGKAVWIEPRLVCNIKFLEWTNGQHLRNPVFMGLRTDKAARDVIQEIPIVPEKHESESSKEKTLILSGKKVKLTNSDKIYWPEDGYTKGDLIQYYQAIGKYILPYLENKPQSLNRHPNGIHSQGFYQKDMEVKQLPVWAKTAKIYSKSNRKYLDYLICNNTATLLYMSNLGCIEINPWHSKYTKPDHPDYLILDLDPADISFVHVVDTALVIKEICDETGILSYCKTSGATGLHIYIPLAAKYTYDEAKTFAEILATITHKRLPDTTSIERAVVKRKDRIYIDFLQNNKGQTIAAPYAVRPRELATVSAPLMWKEVNHKLTPQMFTISNMQKRIEKVGDLWAPVIKKGINLIKTLKEIEKL